jgi:hypothetical protein
MTTMYIPGTYKLDIDLSSDWSVEMKFTSLEMQTDDEAGWFVETNLPFNINLVIARNGEFCFYDHTMRELLERWHEGDAELRDFFSDKKHCFLSFLKIISPVDKWTLIC